MADANVIGACGAKVHRSFVVTVEVDESRSVKDLKFISTRMGKDAAFDALVNGPGEVFFEGSEELATAWMSLGNGALPLQLFMDPGVAIAPAPAQQLRQAREILNRLYDDGDLDHLQTDRAYDALRLIEDLIAEAETSMASA